MGDGGKAFEQLVHRIETLLLHAYGLPPGRVRTEWQYRVRGKDSKGLREVDVALFVDVGIRTLFVAIECRDHKRRQSVTWIEQLAKKQADIQADRMVAVSRAGFVEGAVRCAKANSIELYTLSDRSAFGDDKALAEMELVVARPQLTLLKFAWSRLPMMLSPFDPQPALTDQEATDLTTDFEGPNWIDRGKHRRTSLKEVLSSTLTWEKLVQGIPCDGSHGHKETATDFEPGQYVLAREFPHDAMLTLAGVAGEFEVWWEPKLVPASRVVQYRSADDEPVIEIHEYDGRTVGLDGQTLFFAPIAARRPNPTG